MDHTLYEKLARLHQTGTFFSDFVVVFHEESPKQQQQHIIIININIKNQQKS